MSQRFVQEKWEEYCSKVLSLTNLSAEDIEVAKDVFFAGAIATFAVTTGILTASSAVEYLRDWTALDAEMAEHVAGLKRKWESEKGNT